MAKKNTLKVPYAAAVYGDAEINAAIEVLKNPSRIVAGPAVKKFESRIARVFGKKTGVMVNSGSSANLIALEALALPAGSEVITPVLTFATTVAPILQKGLVPVFADVLVGNYQIDTSKIEALITKKTKALMIPSLIGNLPDFEHLQKLAKKHTLWLIEDSCDTLGARFAGKPTGVYSDISTTSFYASHIITAAGGGGMACFRDEKIARRALVIANWGRESTLFGAYEKSEELKRRFAGVLDGQPYDAKFLFTEVGYNFQSAELNGAFGLVQLDQLKKFTQHRKKMFRTLRAFFKQYEQWFILPEQDPRTDTAWLAFPLTLRNGTPFSRYEITKYLEEQNIQTRPIFTGNITRQPAFKNAPYKRIRGASYPVADHIMRNSFLIGCHHGLTLPQLEHVQETFTKFLKKY